MKRVIQPLAALALLSFSCLTFADTAVNDAAIKVKWGYKGDFVPERWAQLDPSFALCATGKMQSPIDISKDFHKDVNKLSVNYQSAPLEVVKDGTTDLTLGSQKLIINDGHGIQLNFKQAKPKETILLDGNTYDLVQLHSHSPSENRWHGQSFPLEIHFVHQGKNGKVAVMGVFVKAGDENPALKEIVSHLPEERGTSHVIGGAKINPIELLPTVKNYYSFPGSLTTPPCTEDLLWMVMATPITASPAQILLLRQAAGGDNARPVQPLNKRWITFSDDQTLRTKV